LEDVLARSNLLVDELLPLLHFQLDDFGVIFVLILDLPLFFCEVALGLLDALLLECLLGLVSE
jgi:hypothetical protein